MRPSATSVCGLKLPVYEVYVALRVELLPGLGGATDEYLRLLRLITGLHAHPKTPRETSINYPDALPVQVLILLAFLPQKKICKY